MRAWFRLDLLAGITLAAYLLPAALGDASLANLPPEAGLYACLFGGLVFWIFCGSRYTVDFCYFRNLARDRLVAWGNYRREYYALWRPRGRHCVVGLAHRLRCLARESRSHGPFHLGECYDRLQMRRRAFPCQHAITEAFRFPRRSWKFLGEHRLLLQTPNETNSMSFLVGGIALALLDPWKNFPQTQTGRALRCNRRNYCCLNAFVGNAWRETDWRPCPREYLR